MYELVLVAAQICTQCRVIKSWYGCVVPYTRGPLQPKQEIKCNIPHTALTMVSGVDENRVIYFLGGLKSCVKPRLWDCLDHPNQQKYKPEKNGKLW